jgi:hypothetical protein
MNSSFVAIGKTGIKINYKIITRRYRICILMPLKAAA